VCIVYCVFVVTLTHKIDSSISEEVMEQTTRDLLAEIDTEIQNSPTSKEQAKSSIMVWKMMKWIGKSKYNVAKRTRYNSIREQVMKTISQSGITLRHSNNNNSVPLSKQGSLEAYSDENLKKRETLSNSDKIIDAIDMWWNLLNKTVQSSEQQHVTKDLYIPLLFVLYSILLPVENINNGNIWEIAYYKQIAESDWIGDCRGHDCIDHERFYMAIFELADLWCESCEEDEYITFIRSITRKVWEQSKLLGVHGILFSEVTISENPSAEQQQQQQQPINTNVSIDQLIELEKQSGVFVDWDGFVFQSKFEKRLLEQGYFNHSEWSRSQIDVQVDITDLLETYDPVKELHAFMHGDIQPSITERGDQQNNTMTQEKSNEEHDEHEMIQDQNSEIQQQEEDTTEEEQQQQQQQVVDKPPSIAPLLIDIPMNTIEYEMYAEQSSSRAKSRPHTPVTSVTARPRQLISRKSRSNSVGSNVTSSRTSTSMGIHHSEIMIIQSATSSPTHKSSLGSARGKINNVSLEPIPEHISVQRKRALGSKRNSISNSTTTTTGTIKMLHSYENNEQKKRLKSVQSKYLAGKSIPPTKPTLEKVILNQVRNTFNGNYPKSYVHLCGFIEQGIVRADEVYGENKRNRNMYTFVRCYSSSRTNLIVHILCQVLVYGDAFNIDEET
jgi:hypothetical protein